MTSRFAPNAAPASAMRPGYMRMGSSNGVSSPSPGNTPTNYTPSTSQSFGGYTPSPPTRQGSGGGVAGNSSSRRLDRKDTKEIAWVHWRALRDYLSAWGEEESPTARASAREKLTRLMRLQFLELSTDVYDELMRRLAVESGSLDGPAPAPFLPVREDFHPKRNQARQKLATLPQHRFKDLASDVFFELRRRYPEFQEGIGPSESLKSFEEHTGPGGSPITFNQQGAPNGSGARPTHNRKGSSVGSSADRSAGMLPSSGSRERFNLTMPTNDVVVPNKSRLQEEAIEVPYARDSTGEIIDDGLQHRNNGPSGLRERPDSSEHGPSTNSHEQNGTDEQYIDRMSFTSTAKSKAGGNGWEEQEEQLRAGYELRIVGLQRQLQRAEGERDELQRTINEEKERRKDYEDEVRGLKERAQTHASSLRSIQHELDVARDAAEAVRSQTEQTSRQAQEEIAQWRERCEGLEDELRRLEDERADRATTNARGGDVDEGMASELQNEVRSLVEELKTLSLQNEELVSERESERESHAKLAAKVEEYKRQATALRTELRNLKATSTLFIAKPLSDDHLPASPDGNIADVNVSEFQSGVDELLGAARSSQPSSVLPCMKAIVEAVSKIGDDVKAFEEHPNLDVDVSRLESLKHESTQRLGALMTAARNHAMSSGLSPLSLIDGAAGQLSANVVEIIKLLKIRRSRSTRDILRKRSSMSIGDMVRRSSGIAEEEEPAPEHLREPAGSRLAPRGFEPPEFRIKSFQSASSTAQRSDSFDLERKASVASTVKSDYDRHERLVQPKDPFARMDSTPTPATEVSDEWENVKPYLDEQGAVLVRSIQDLLEAIRKGGLGPQLNEHLNKIIAVSSSFVAVSRGALPARSRPAGEPLLADMVSSTDRLSEAQQAAARAGGFTKDMRQEIASASFAVAKALKVLMKLGSE